MKTIDGRYHYQVKDLIEDLKSFPGDSLVYSVFHDETKKFHEKPIYKTVETAEPDEVYLYLGDSKR